MRYVAAFRFSKLFLWPSTNVIVLKTTVMIFATVLNLASPREGNIPCLNCTGSKIWQEFIYDFLYGLNHYYLIMTKNLVYNKFSQNFDLICCKPNELELNFSLTTMNENQFFCTTYHMYIIVCLDLPCNYELETRLSDGLYTTCIENWTLHRFIASLDELIMPITLS